MNFLEIKREKLRSFIKTKNEDYPGTRLRDWLMFLEGNLDINFHLIYCLIF